MNGRPNRPHSAADPLQEAHYRLFGARGVVELVEGVAQLLEVVWVWELLGGEAAPADHTL